MLKGPFSLLQRAINIDPEYAAAHREKTWSFWPTGRRCIWPICFYTRKLMKGSRCLPGFGVWGQSQGSRWNQQIRALGT